MRKIPNNVNDALSFVRDILVQGDFRYRDVESECDLASFLLRDAIVLNEKAFPTVLKEPDEKAIRRHRVQGSEKCVAEALLKLQGFGDKDICFERNFRGSVPDVIAGKDLVVPVECCSCRVDKIIEYLAFSEVKEVWVLTRGVGPWVDCADLVSEDDRMGWYIFRRGINWEKTYSNFDLSKRKRLREAFHRFHGLQK